MNGITLAFLIALVTVLLLTVVLLKKTEPTMSTKVKKYLQQIEELQKQSIMV